MRRSSLFATAMLLLAFSRDGPDQPEAANALHNLALRPEDSQSYIFQSATANFGESIRAAVVAGSLAVSYTSIYAGDITASGYGLPQLLVFASSASVAFACNFIYGRTADTGYFNLFSNPKTLAFIQYAGVATEIFTQLYTIVFSTSSQITPQSSTLAQIILTFTQPVMGFLTELTSGIFGQAITATAGVVWPYALLLGALAAGLVLTTVKVSWMRSIWNSILSLFKRIPVVGIVVDPLIKMTTRSKRSVEEDVDGERKKGKSNSGDAVRPEEQQIEKDAAAVIEIANAEAAARRSIDPRERDEYLKIVKALREQLEARVLQKAPVETVVDGTNQPNSNQQAITRLQVNFVAPIAFQVSRTIGSAFFVSLFGRFTGN
tara:strand:- start:2592 stop:3722 length:1131 start_codon:yes stop_codon:yes gene_type:complete